MSLDVDFAIGDSFAMLAQPYHLYIERIDVTKNMARFYALSIDRTLFGTPCLTRRWGRIGTTGRSKVEDFDREDDAVAKFLDLLRSKRSRGYLTVQPSATQDLMQQANRGEAQLRLKPSVAPMS